MANHVVARGEKEREFTQEDQETLVMFATQAALVIANARRHREEQRARADLETEVTPVAPTFTRAGVGPGGMPTFATGMASSLLPWARSASLSMSDPTSSAGTTHLRVLPSSVATPALPACRPAPSWKSRSTRGR